MYHREQRRNEQGKNNAAVDERYFKLAVNNLYAELAFAMGKNKSEMQLLFTERMKKEQ